MKFRVWDKHNKGWEKEVALNQDGKIIGVWDYDWCYIEDASNYVVQLATGLKDKNGRDVYEDDVVKGYFSVFDKTTKLFEKQPVKLHHIWLYGTNGVRAAEWVVSQNHFGSESAYTMQNIYWEEFEVVGNRYETPDIFEDENA